MNANIYKSKSLIVGLVAFAVGVAIGVAAMEIGRQNQKKMEATNQESAIRVPDFSADSNQWNPFREIQRMQEKMNRSLNEMSERFQLEPRIKNDTNQMSLSSGGLPGWLTDSNQWDPFQEIQKMQAQMDQSFNDMFEQFRMQPQFNLLSANPNYSSSLRIEDLKDRYVVRAFLPDVKTSDVHVTLNNGQTLTVEVNNRQSEESTKTNVVSQAAIGGINSATKTLKWIGGSDVGPSDAEGWSC